jgi:hypothetical protein
MIYMFVRWNLINNEDFQSAFELGTLVYLLEGFVGFRALILLWQLFKHRGVIALKHRDMQQSYCRCGEAQKQKYMIFTSHSFAPLTYDTKRIEMSCHRCKRMIYHCNVIDEEGVDLDINFH